jgi:hypothetical protein
LTSGFDEAVQIGRHSPYPPKLPSFCESAWKSPAGAENRFELLRGATPAIWPLVEITRKSDNLPTSSGLEHWNVEVDVRMMKVTPRSVGLTALDPIRSVSPRIKGRLGGIGSGRVHGNRRAAELQLFTDNPEPNANDSLASGGVVVSYVQMRSPLDAPDAPIDAKDCASDLDATASDRLP